jgi:hypothetical protein
MWMKNYSAIFLCMAVAGLRSIGADFSPASVPGLVLWLDAADVNGDGNNPVHYAANTGWLNCTYARYQKYVEETFWKAFLNTGAEFVPLAATGFDMRPRIETGVPWSPSATNLNINMYHEQPTPQEFAQHLKNALALLKQYPQQTPANAVLIYAWNEFDEGGWLCPTLGEGTARLDAVRKMLIGNE